MTSSANPPKESVGAGAVSTSFSVTPAEPPAQASVTAVTNSVFPAGPVGVPFSRWGWFLPMPPLAALRILRDAL